MHWTRTKVARNRGLHCTYIHFRVTSRDRHNFFLLPEITDFSMYSPKSLPGLLPPRDQHLISGEVSRFHLLSRERQVPIMHSKEGWGGLPKLLKPSTDFECRVPVCGGCCLRFSNNRHKPAPPPSPLAPPTVIDTGHKALCPQSAGSLRCRWPGRGGGCSGVRCLAGAADATAM